MIRTRRLQREYEKIVAELSGNEFVHVQPIQGEPPWHYRVTYQLTGLVWDEESHQTKPSGKHVVDIVLPTGYPRQGPVCTMRTPIWHPNIGDYVCIGDFWSPGVTLVEIIVHIADMIQYKSYNLSSPVNKEAAAWARRHIRSFPIGTRTIYVKPDNTESSAIAQGLNNSQSSRDDVDIILGPIRDLEL